MVVGHPVADDLPGRQVQPGRQIQPALAGGDVSDAAWSCLAQARRLSPLTPSSRATSATVLPEERTSATASRLNSSEYRFVYLLLTWRYFLWNLTSQSPGVHDQGEASRWPSPSPCGQAVIRRKQLPFGAPRPTTSTGNEPDFPGDAFRFTSACLYRFTESIAEPGGCQAITPTAPNVSDSTRARLRAAGIVGRLPGCYGPHRNVSVAFQRHDSVPGGACMAVDRRTFVRTSVTGAAASVVMRLAGR